MYITTHSYIECLYLDYCSMKLEYRKHRPDYSQSGIDLIKQKREEQVGTPPKPLKLTIDNRAVGLRTISPT